MPKKNPETNITPIDSRLKSFLRKAAAIIATEKGLNASSRVKLQTLADHDKLPPELFDEAIARLQTSFDAGRNLTHYEKAFAKFLDTELEKLTGDVLSPGMEKNAIDLAKRKFEINGTRAEQLIQIRAEAAGISRISFNEAASFADHSIADRVGELTSLDEADKRQLYKVGKKWGLNQDQVDRIVYRQLRTNQSSKTSLWKTAAISAIVCFVLLGLTLTMAYAAGWIPESWVAKLIDDKTQQVISPKLVDSPVAVSRIPQPLFDELESLRKIDIQLGKTADRILDDNESQRRLGYQQLASRVCTASLGNQQRLSDIARELFYEDPDESSVLEIIGTLQKVIDLARTDQFSVRDLKNAYQANQLLGQLYFARGGSTFDSRREAVGECIRSALQITLDECRDYEDFLDRSELIIANDQWSQLIQMTWGSPGRASVLLLPLMELTESRLDTRELSQFRDDALISIMETDGSHWKDLQNPIRDSVAGCDEAKLIDWIAVFSASNETMLRELLGRALLPRIDVQPKSRRREDIDEAIINFGLTARNQVLRPVIDRNDLLENFVADTMEMETADDGSGISPDRIAQLAMAVNIQMAFCAAIENATQIDDSSFVDFDRLIAIPEPRLRELISLPIDRRGNKSKGAATATASDKRRLSTSLERLSDLSPGSSGLRILALKQLERVAHRFESISYRDAEILASYFLHPMPVKEQLEVEKLIASFSHWPNLALALADRIPVSDTNADQALSFARILMGSNFELGRNGEWKQSLQSKIIAAVSQGIENQIDQDPDNTKSNWIRLRIYLNESYRERLAIKLNRTFLDETFLEPYQSSSRLIQTVAQGQSPDRMPLNVERAVALIQQISANEIEKTAFANQVLVLALVRDLGEPTHSFEAEALLADLNNAIQKQTLAGDHLYATELALLRVVNLKRQSLVNDLLEQAKRRSW